MKKLLAFFLTILLLTLPVFAEEVDSPRGVCGDEVAWSLDGNTLTISGYGEMYDFEEGAPWADYADDIMKVEFVGEVTYVGAHAFEHYKAIMDVDFGDTVKTLGAYSFSGCDGLTRIHLPASFKTFGEECLRGCTNLKAIHCDGSFPSFKLNCLWQTETKIFYPAKKPWPVNLIQELEEAFSYRIEFLDSDGNDPFKPVTATETTAPETTVPETTVPETTVPETTQPATIATTMPETSAPVFYETETWGSEPPVTVDPTTPPPVWTTVAPTEPVARRSNGLKIGGAIIVAVLAGMGAGALIVGKNKKGRYN